jgi:hypothetical protein
MSTSRASDAGHLALADLSAIAATLDAEYRIIGGHMVTLLVRLHGYRARGAANRFEREYHDSHGRLELVVDILAPSYRGVLLPNQRHGGLVVDEVPGVALALSAPSTIIDLTVSLRSGDQARMRLLLPHLGAAVCIKALSYRGRLADKDAVDLWRLMNAAYAAGLRAGDWPTGVTGRDAAAVLYRFFARAGAQGLRQISQRGADHTRMQAIIKAIVPESIG